MFQENGYEETELKNSSIDRFIASLPKTETHLHFEGALPYELLREMDPERFPEHPDFRNPDFKFENFVVFENLLIDHAMAWYTSPEQYYEAGKRIFANLLARNVKYVETSVHLPIAEFIGANPREIVSAVKEAAPENLEVRVIGAVTRDALTDHMRPYLEDAHSWEELDGIDLHGQEWLDLEEWTRPLWLRCKEAGKILKAHAGEFGGPDKIYEAVHQLDVERIQHGVRATEDPKLMEMLAERQTVLDTCPISNVKLGVFESAEEHSLPELIDAGIPCTISTDDPLCFVNTIDDEYRMLARDLGFSKEALAEVAKTGFRHARCDEAFRDAWISEIDRLVVNHD